MTKQKYGGWASDEDYNNLKAALERGAQLPLCREQRSPLKTLCATIAGAAWMACRLAA